MARALAARAWDAEAAGAPPPGGQTVARMTRAAAGAENVAGASAAGLTALEETARGLAALLGDAGPALWELAPARAGEAAPAPAATDVAAAEAVLAAWAHADAAIRLPRAEAA